MEEKKQYSYEQGLDSFARQLLRARNPIKEFRCINLISIKGLKDAILNYKISNGDTVILNSMDFKDVVIDHRIVYGVSIKFPYYLIGVLISEDNANKIPQGQMGIIREENS